MNPLRGKKIEILLKEARHHLGALAAMHIMACKLSAGDIILMGGKTYFLDAGRIPTEQPTLELPLIKKTSQILIGTAAPKGGFTLRWALSSELLTSFGWPSGIIKAEHRRSQVLAAAPAGHTHDSCGPVSAAGSGLDVITHAGFVRLGSGHVCLAKLLHAAVQIVLAGIDHDQLLDFQIFAKLHLA